MKKRAWLIIALAAMLLLAAAAMCSCAKEDGDQSALSQATATPEPAVEATKEAAAEPTAEASANAEKAGVLATINGVDVPIDEAYDEYSYYEMIYTMYGYTDELDELKQEIADYYVDLELIYLQFAGLGMEADMEAVSAAASENYQTAIQDYTTYVTDTSLTDEQVLEEAEKLLIEEGYDLAYFEKIAYNEARLVAVLEHYTKDITVTEEDVKAYYDDLVASDKELFESNPAYYEQAVSYGERIMYVPEGFRSVKHILVLLSEEDQDTMYDLESQMESIEAALAAEGADTETLNKNKAEVQAQIDAIFATIEPKAQEILTKLAAGEDFLALMEEYGEDPGMKSEPYATEGYAVHAESAQWVTAFRDAAMALEQVGDVSQPVRTSYGLHIIRYEGDVASGAVAYEDVRADLESEVQDTLMNSYYNDLVDQWRSEAEITMYLENFDAMAAAE